MKDEASETPEKIVCEKCGAEMHIVRDSYQMGMECPNCGWGWVTTYNEPIEVDYSVYHVVLDSKDSSLANVKLVASIVNCNYLRAKRIIENSPSEIFSGKAVDVREIRDRLVQAGVAFRIEPDFPY
ncbi:MAG: hypothetical protein IIY32_10865 [Thermoguttaceae bacterium]|nr:hypothetical protein [Thermoguttaceae bacterium]